MTVTGRFFLAASVLAMSAASQAQAQSNSSTPPPTMRVMRVQPVTPVNPAILQAMGTQSEITPPPEVATRGGAGSVTLKAGPNSAMVRSLVVKRQFTLAQAKAMRRVTVGQTEMNLEPTFNNPRALFNVAQKVRGQANAAEVLSEDTRILEVDQGLLIRSFLTYRVKPGVCTDNVRRGALYAAGLTCATQLSDQARTAAFSNPRDPHYVRDATARARAIEEARVKSAQIEADLNQSVAQIRASLNNPAKRAEFDAALGAGETARLTTMTDEQIKAEIVNSGETSVEQTLFVPRLDRVDPEIAQKIPFKNMAKTNTGTPMFVGGMTVKPSGTINPAIIGAMSSGPVVKTQTVPEKVFLTGFTLGRSYEWKERIEKTIKTCLVSCKKTYYVEVFAGFNYGFGLRFPMKVGGTYTFKEQSGAKSAEFKAAITPFNGGEADYLATGLSGSQLFGGKELVAQIGAHAGAGYKLPIIGSDSIDIPVGVDLTEYLPGDFYKGQFTPPTPGGLNNPKAERFFEEVDLIGGRANFGVIGAQVFPGVRVELTSDMLTFNLHDFNKTGNADTLITQTGQVVPLGIDSANRSRFSISDPKYNVAFLITPGLNARLFVDVAVWSHSWNFPVWFPQLALKLPPGGVEFACHEGTECSRTITVSPGAYNEQTGPAGVMGMELEKWGQGFDNKWLSECADETCRFGIRFVRQGTIYAAMHKFDANTQLKLTDFSQDFIRADMEAQSLVAESNIRKTKDISQDYREIYRAIWTKRCSDKICFDKIKGISTLHLLEVNAQQKAHADWTTNQVLIEVLKKFTPIYQGEIDASKARVAAEQAAAARRAVMQANIPALKRP
ncbi:MAG: hypothetical protein ACKOPQ_00280 [Novosphingobium sp.]